MEKNRKKTDSEGLLQSGDGHVMYEIRIRESAELYKTLVESAPDAIYSLDADGRYLSVNPAAAAYFGKIPYEMVGKSIADFYPEQFAERMIASVKRVIETGDPMSVYNQAYPTAMGTFVFDTTLSPIFSSAAGAPYVVGISRNMTDSIAALEAMRMTQDKLSNIFEATPDFIILAGADCAVREANKSFLNWAGFSKDNAIGQQASELAGLDAGIKMADALKKMSGGGSVSGLKSTFINREGDARQVELNAIPIKNQDSIAEFLFIGRDITDRAKAESEKEALREQLIHSQKMEAVGKLAGGISHDFNNFLSIIKGNADLALSRIAPDSEAAEFVKKSIVAIGKAKELTKNLLTFSRKEKPSAVPISIGLIVEETIDLLARTLEGSVCIEFIHGPDIKVEADLNQIQQALLNIMMNSVDAMPDGGKITVTCEEIQLEHESNRRSLLNINEGSYCVVSISDTGSGIPQDIIDKVLDPFFTTKDPKKGTGLGLSITNSIIRNHKGAVSLSSSLEGTRIDLFLPVSEYSEDQDGSEMEVGEGEMIYIVDDDPDFSEMISEALDVSGYKPLMAPQGEEGLEMFRKLKNDIAIVMMDIRMPGMSGKEYFNKLVEIDPCVRVIICSGLKPQGFAEELVASGRCGYVQKPFNIDSLCDVISAELNK